MTNMELKNRFGIVGRSKEIKDLIDIILQVAKSDISVLLHGESGVGKEIFANAIHEASDRSHKQMVSVNCGAIPEGLLESELFGHEKGSFTGAIGERKGYFEIADGGTLFLDEIAEMPLTTQVKLLRVLETKEFMRIGSEKVTKVDVRIIAASNKDLQHEVIAKRFRNDLYFRLKAVSLNIPPLRQRKEDIIPLVDYFLLNYARTHSLPEFIVNHDVYNILNNYDWPGNIRELKNVVESAAALSKNGILNYDVIKPLLSFEEFEESSKFLPVYTKKSSDVSDREMIFGALIEIKRDLEELKHLATKYDSPPDDYIPGSIDDVKPLWEYEKEAIRKVLHFAKGNKRRTAKLLQISERTLYRKLDDYNIEF